MPLVDRVRLRLAVDVERDEPARVRRPPRGGDPQRASATTPPSARTRRRAARRNASQTGGNSFTASSASTKRTLAAPLERLRERAPDARERHLAAPRREPVAEAAVDRLLRRPQRGDRLAALVRRRRAARASSRAARRAAGASDTRRRRDAGARQRAAGHGEVERERTRRRRRSRRRRRRRASGRADVTWSKRSSRASSGGRAEVLADRVERAGELRRGRDTDGRRRPRPGRLATTRARSARGRCPGRASQAHLLGALDVRRPEACRRRASRRRVVRTVPGYDRGSPSASFGPASCAKSNDIGQLIRICEPRAALHRDRARRRRAAFESTSPQTWQPCTTWTIVSRTVGDATARRRDSDGADAAEERFTHAICAQPLPATGEPTDPGCGLVSARARALDPRRPPLPRARPRLLARRRSSSASVAVARGCRRCSRTRSPCPAPTPTAPASILARHFGERPDGVFTVVFRAHLRRRRAARCSAGSRRGARSCRRAHATQLQAERRHPLRRDRHDARPPAREGATRRRLRRALAGTPRASSPASPRSSTTSSPILSVRPAARRGDRAADRAARALRRARPLARRARPVRLRRVHDHARRSRVVYVLAHAFTMVSYVTNLVELIGLGLAVDYSLLDRLPLPRGARRAATTSTTRSCARWRPPAARSSSPGATVAIGLALLLLRARCRSSARSASAASSCRSRRSPRRATLQPALLSLLGRRGARAPVAGSCAPARLPLPCCRARSTSTRLLGAARPRDHAPPRRVPRRRRRACSSRSRVPGALPPGHARARSPALPPRPGVRDAGSTLLRDRVGAGALTPTEIVVDTGPRRRRARARRCAPRSNGSPTSSFHDPEAYVVAIGRSAAVRRRRAAATRASSSSAGTSTATSATQAFVRRLRDDARPRRALPRRACASYVGGAPPQGVDYLVALVRLRSRGSCSACSCSRTSSCCARSARSLLPLKAVC